MRKSTFVAFKEVEIEQLYYLAREKADRVGGAEMEAYGGVVRYAATLAPMRVALLSPGGDRDARYAASAEYAAALVDEVVHALTDGFPTYDRPVLLGQRLGALAAVPVAWT